MISKKDIGLYTVVLGVLLMSFDATLLRIIDQTSLAVSFWRGNFIALASLLMIVFCYLKKINICWKNDVASWGNSIMFALSSIFFTLAMKNTSAANTLFIMATMPFITVILTRIFLNKKIEKNTYISFLFIAFGIAIIFLPQITNLSGSGEIYAFFAAIFMSSGFIFSMYRKSSPLCCTFLGGILSAGFSLPFASSIILSNQAWIPMLLEGFIVMPIALLCLTIGPKYIPPHHVSILVLGETVLGPIWVWIFLKENPGINSLFGGFIIIATIVFLNYKNKIDEKKYLTKENTCDI